MHERNGLKFYIPPGEEFHLEKTAERALGRPDLSVVVDIGAHRGAFSFPVAAANPLATVYAIEPCADNYKALCEGIDANHLRGRVIPLQAAVWNRTGVLDIWKNGTNTGQRSPAFRGGVYKEPVIGIYFPNLLESILSRHDTIDYLKIDVEGCEWALFSIPTGILYQNLKRVKFLELSLHALDNDTFYETPMGWNTKERILDIGRVLDICGISKGNRYIEGADYYGVPEVN